MTTSFKITDAGSARAMTNHARLLKSRGIDFKPLFKRFEHVAEQGYCRFLLDHNDKDNSEFLCDGLRSFGFTVTYTEYGLQIDW